MDGPRVSVVLDYSNWRPPSPQALAAHGVVGVVAYIKPARFGWPKAIKKSEDVALDAAGIARAYNYENNPGDWRTLNGSVTGAEAATAMLELGHGNDVPVYVSFDEEIQPAQFEAAAVYFRAFFAACPHPRGAYGEGALIEYLAAHAGLVYGWESESTSFPGNNAPTPHTVLVQHYGQQLPGLPGAYDVNTVINADWGQYPRPAAPKPPVPPKPKVPVRYDPPINVLGGIRASLSVDGGELLIGPLGHLYALDGAKNMGGPIDQNGNPKPYWIGKQVRDLVAPNDAEKNAGKHYTVLSTDPAPNNRFAYPESS